MDTNEKTPKKPKSYFCKTCDFYTSNKKDFKRHSLTNKHLLLTGANAHLGVSAAAPQKVTINENFNWSTELVKRDIKYTQGMDNITIKQSGTYDIFADIICNESVQIALFVNGKPLPSTIFGRDSGAVRCLMRQMIKLYRGDLITVNNYESSIGTVTVAENPGGNAVGQSATFTLFLLSKCDDRVEKCIETKHKE